MRDTLVTAAAMAIMASILFPALRLVHDRRAAEQADQQQIEARSICLRHLEYLARAMREYARDHGNRLPDADGWQAALHPYLAASVAGLGESEHQVLCCPNDPSAGPMGSYVMDPGASGADLASWPPSGAEAVILYEARPEGHFPGDLRMCVDPHGRT